MKKIISIVLILALSAMVAACGKEPEPPQPPLESEPMGEVSASLSTSSNEEETAIKGTAGAGESQAESMTAEPGENSRILIAYFTWAENTVVEDPSSVDVDAVTSASVLLPGNVGLMAQWIQEETGGDTFSILTAEPYSSDYDECLDRAIREHDDGIYPALTGRVENIADYDIVFLGFPNWWYSCPMAILTFIRENDLSGKTIIPFASHGTGGFAASLRDISAALSDSCTVLQEFGAYRPEVSGSRPALLEWLQGLDISYEEGSVQE